MGFFDFLTNANPTASVAQGAVSGALQGIGDAAIKIRTAITGEAPLDPTAQAQLAMRVQEIEASLVQAQLAINLADAQSGSGFRGGARPMAMWVCVAAMLYDTVIRAMVPWVLQVAGVQGVPPLPEVGGASMDAIMWGLLGLGGYRSLEKIRGMK